jgi:DNA-binding transcriptional ArsR family regulator
MRAGFLFNISDQYTGCLTRSRDINKLFIDMDTERKARIYLHPLRQKILERLKNHGPLTQTEAARAVDTAPASARFHLLLLLKAGFIARAGTRPGPKGITEKLFRIAAPKRRKPMFSTRHGTSEDRRMRKLALDEVAETHRAGSRIILRTPARFFGLASFDLAASPEELRQLNKELMAIVKRFARGRDARGSTERCRVQLGFYPHP